MAAPTLDLQVTTAVGSVLRLHSASASTPRLPDLSSAITDGTMTVAMP